MNKDTLISTAKRLTNPPKGILAIDESLVTCNKRFEKLGVPTTEEKRRDYRDLLISAPEIENYVSGYILFDETIRQKTKEGQDFTGVMKSKGLDVGIKVDTGTKDLFPESIEKITEGLEGLSQRLKEYKDMGATFAKWRGVYTITDNTPTLECMKANADAFAKYANLCQEHDIVPIVEPEVLIDGSHSIEKCYEVIAKNLDIVFEELKMQNVFIPGILLKTSMITSGRDAQDRANANDVAEMTIKCLTQHVPRYIGGIVFLSGGQDDEEALVNLNAMHKLGTLPWNLTFSFGRAIQNPALKAWAKNPQDILGAQNLLVEAAKKNSLASIGKYEG